MGTHRHPRLTESRRQEVPTWIAEVERLARAVPSATLADAGRLVGADRERVAQWLWFYGRHDLVMRLRTVKTPIAWAALIDEALGRDPNRSLTDLAALFGRTPTLIRRAVIASGRRDLADRLGIKARPRRARHHRPARPQRVVAPPDPERARFPGPSVPGWGAVIEAVVIGYPALTLHDLANAIDRDPDTITEALIRADRTDLLHQLLAHNTKHQDEHQAGHQDELKAGRQNAGCGLREVA